MQKSVQHASAHSGTDQNAENEKGSHELPCEPIPECSTLLGGRTKIRTWDLVLIRD